MEKAAEQGSAIAAAVEGVERHRGSSASGWLTIIFTSTSMQCLYCSCHRRVQKFYVLLIWNLLFGILAEMTVSTNKIVDFCLWLKLDT